MEQVNATATPVDLSNDEIFIPLGQALPCILEIRPMMAFTIVALVEPKRLAFTCPLGAFNMAFLFQFTYRGRPYQFEMAVGKLNPGGVGFVEPKQDGGEWR